MTEATSAESNPTVDDIVTRAYRTAGLLSVYETPSIVQATDARLSLDDIVKETAAEGIYAKSVTMENVTLVESQTDYVMDADVLDVIGTGAYIDASQLDIAHASSETPITLIDREKWQRLSARSATGRPYLYFSDRSTVPVTVRIWPMPDSGNLGTMRLQTHRLPANVTDGGVTAPYQRYWTQFLVYELAHQLALQSSLPIERCTYLETIALAKYKRAKSYSKQQGPRQATLSHPTAWRSR
jgi:ribosomal protein L21